ncbi:hypothetical protein LUZ60_009818 [Juncus effusus]|nr:hypothetical protein LUZ60_009818 [Juncus effusus]
MTTLPSGTIDKLRTGAHNPVGEHRTALVQVTDIVPVDLDEKALWPKHGFYIKLSDCTDSVYASLPADQSDLVLSNKIQLGQFINLDRLEPALPVPVIVGCKPLPGRHPLVATPDPVRSSCRSLRRGSWGNEPGQGLSQTRPVKLDFEERTPAKDANNNMKMVRKSCVIPKSTRSKSVDRRGAARVPKSPFVDDKSSVASTPKSIKTIESENESNCSSVVTRRNKICAQDVSTPASRAVKRLDISSSSSSLFSDENDKNGSVLMCKNKLINSPYETDSSNKKGSGPHLSLPGKLSTLGKEAIQQREAAQKAAHKALRDMTATDNVVRILKLFSELNRVAKPDNPSRCFEQFLSFHQETLQAIKDIETIQAATSMATNPSATSNPPDSNSILQEIPHNSNKTPAKKRPINPHPKPINPIQNNNHNNDNNHLESCLRNVKEIEREAGSWFVEFLDRAVEAGLKKSNGSNPTRKEVGGCVCAQSLMLRVVNWIEMEQKIRAHPRANQIARKLRIKAKNPAN